jgi:hypothetical protein
MGAQQHAVAMSLQQRLLRLVAIAAVTAGHTRLSSQATPCSLSARVTAGHTSRKYCSAAAGDVGKVEIRNGVVAATGAAEATRRQRAARPHCTAETIGGSDDHHQGGSCRIQVANTHVTAVRTAADA